MLKIRLTRRGRKKMAMYDVVIANSTSPRDGRFIEKIGAYNPTTNPATILLDEAKALDWLIKGAQPSPTVKAILSYRGVLYQKHLQIGVIKGAITQELADSKFQEWKDQKDAKITKKVDNLAAKKSADEKSRFDAETRVKEARTEAIRKKLEVPVQETTETPAETPTESAE